MKKVLCNTYLGYITVLKVCYTVTPNDKILPWDSWGDPCSPLVAVLIVKSGMVWINCPWKALFNNGIDGAVSVSIVQHYVLLSYNMWSRNVQHCEFAQLEKMCGRSKNPQPLKFAQLEDYSLKMPMVSIKHTTIKIHATRRLVVENVQPFCYRCSTMGVDMQYKSILAPSGRNHCILLIQDTSRLTNVQWQHQKNTGNTWVVWHRHTVNKYTARLW